MRFIEADRVPGKARFIKYLYLLDYFYAQAKGSKLTSIEWKFHKTGPSSAAVDKYLNRISNEYKFTWKKQVKLFPVHKIKKELIDRDWPVNYVVTQKLFSFNKKTLEELVDYTNNTEPMLNARKGDVLDFSSVPRIPSSSFESSEDTFFDILESPDRSYSIDFVTPTDETNVEKYNELPTEIGKKIFNISKMKRIESFRTRKNQLVRKAKERQKSREEDFYQEAMQRLAREFQGETPELSGNLKLSNETIESFLKDE